MLPFTYWYEALRRFLLGHGASQMLSQWSDAQLLGALAITTVGLGFLLGMGLSRAREPGAPARPTGALDPVLAVWAVGGADALRRAVGPPSRPGSVPAA